VILFATTHCNFAKKELMIRRKFFNLLDEVLPDKQIIVITGMRRSGKTTSVKYLLDKIQDNNKMYFDLERVEYRILFKETNYQNIIRALGSEGLDLSQKAFIAIDEIQLVPDITSVMKYLYDNFDIKFIVTGSSSFYLKNHFTESLAGRKRVIEISTLGFDEYLTFRGINASFNPGVFQKINPVIYNRLLPFYKDYLEYGGFPEVVLTDKISTREALLKDIINSYLQIDIQYLADFTKVDHIYKIIALLTTRVCSKTDFSKLAGITGINRQLIKDYLLFFEQTFLIRQIPAFVKNIDREIALQKKLYFTDNGLLSMLGKPNYSALLENSIANQLSGLGDVRYYARRNGKEIDFILDGEKAFEVKETPGFHDVQVLNMRSGQIGINEAYVVGLFQSNPGFADFVWAGDIS
jgi:predicted AAA+ superfamily ATPase